MPQTGLKPTVLLIHGAWHTPRPHYSKLINGLRTAGFNVVAPQLPTMNGARPPDSDLSDDVRCLQQEAGRLVEAGNPVLVLCHSYGGLVTTNALTEELSFASRQGQVCANAKDC